MRKRRQEFKYRRQAEEYSSSSEPGNRGMQIISRDYLNSINAGNIGELLYPSDEGNMRASILIRIYILLLFR